MKYIAPSDFTTTSLGRSRRLPWKLLATTVMLPSASVRVTRRVRCSAETMRPCRSRVRPLASLVFSIATVDALTRRVFHPARGIDVVEEQVAAFLPPERTLGRTDVAAEAFRQFDDGLSRVEDAGQLRRHRLDAPRGLRARRAEPAHEQEAAGGGRHFQHLSA